MKNIIRIIRRIKTELFFIRRLVSEGYGPRYWWPYLKNRFFWRLLVSKISRYDYVADPDLELHTVCEKKAIWMLVWSLRSFLIMSGLRPVIVIHDDGSIDSDSAGLINSKFANVKILFRKETTEQVASLPNLPESIRQVRKNCHFFFENPIDILALSKAKKIIIMNTDILFFKPPTEVIDFVMGKTNYDALASQNHRRGDGPFDFDLMMDEYYTQKYKLDEKGVVYVNSGFILFNREKFNVDQLVEYLEHTKRMLTDYFLEMAYFGCMLAQVNFAFLPLDRYHFKGPVNEKTVFKHFTSPRRYEMFAYGIDMVKNILEKKERKV